MGAEPVWSGWSSNAIERAADIGRVLISPIIYAEVSVRFSRIEELEAALPITMVEREGVPFAAAFLAAKCFHDYRRRGGAKTSPPPDFFICAHAALAGYGLLMRDAARHRTYFPKLQVIAPDVPA